MELPPSNLDALRGRLRAAEVDYADDDKIAGVDRLFVHDPFGNRLEIQQAI